MKLYAKKVQKFQYKFYLLSFYSNTCNYLWNIVFYIIFIFISQEQVTSTIYFLQKYIYINKKNKEHIGDFFFYLPFNLF